MDHVIDQFSDPALGILVKHLHEMPALEAFVKTAEMDSNVAAALPNTAFAWPDERKFPIHTPEHAALSYAYTSKTAGIVPPFVEDAIKQALEVYGVPESVFERVKEAAEEPSAYLLPERRLFAVKTAEDVEHAQSSLVDQMEKLPLEDRATACSNLVKIAKVTNTTLHPRVMKLAGFVVSDTHKVRTWLEARAEACDTTHTSEKVAYQALADGLHRAPAESADREGLIKLASAIAQLDESAGLVRHYDRKLPDPLQTVFNTEKTAAGTIDVDGKLCSLSKLAAMPLSFWEDLGGKEMVDEIAPGGVMNNQKLAEVIATLPLDLKRTLKAQAR